MSDGRSRLDQGKRITLACPHCGAALRVRGSRAISGTCRQIIFACHDHECGATFGGTVEIDHAISPSAKPNPAVQMRQSPPRRRPAPANDDIPTRHDAPGGQEVPPPVNDDITMIPASG